MENKTQYYGSKIEHLILGGKDENESENEERAKREMRRLKRKWTKNLRGREKKARLFLTLMTYLERRSQSSPWRPGTNSTRKSSGWWWTRWPACWMIQMCCSLVRLSWLSLGGVLHLEVCWGMPGSMRGHQGQGVGGYGQWPWCRSWTQLLRSGNLQAGWDDSYEGD